MRVRDRYQILIIVLVFAIALSLRLLGIGWGLPNNWHFFSYHPDEATIALCVSLLDIFSLRMNPHHFNYGSLFFYLVYFALLFAVGVGLVRSQGIFSLSFWRDLHVVGRTLNAFIGASTAFVVWRSAYIAYGWHCALLSALLIAIIPIHVQHSHFMTIDISFAFWAMLSLFYSLRALMLSQSGCFERRQIVRSLVLSGFFGGLSVGTKYGVLLPLCATWLVASLYIVNSGNRLAHQLKVTMRMAVFNFFLPALAMCLVGFLLACPYSILAWNEFTQGVLYEMRHMRIGHGELFLNTGSGHLYHVRVNLNASLGLPLLIASALGVAMGLIKRRPQDVLLLTFIFVYFGMVGCFKVRFARYLMPIIPPLCILTANGVCEVFKAIMRANVSRSFKRIAMCITAVAFLFVLAYTALYSFAIVRVMVLPDTRDLAASWVRENIPLGSTIAVAGNPWFYTVPVKPIMAGPYKRYLSGCRFPESEDVKRVKYNICATWFNIDAIRRVGATAFIATSFEYREFLRLKEKRVSQTLRYLRKLCERGIAFEKRFERPFEFLGLRFGPSYVPHDMMYANPTVRIFVFKKRD
jgi:hypothetical protein